MGRRRRRPPIKDEVSGDDSSLAKLSITVMLFFIASFRFFARVGTMNPPLTPPRRELTRPARTLAPLLGGVSGGSVHGKSITR